MGLAAGAEVTLETWRSAFADESGASFAAIVEIDATLTASALSEPVHGRDGVWKMLLRSGGLYDSLGFTHEARTGDRVYLEWNALAFGLEIGGLTALSLSEAGRVSNVALHHRPFAAVTRFAEALNDTVLGEHGVPPSP
jgi:hypothetical protein